MPMALLLRLEERWRIIEVKDNDRTWCIHSVNAIDAPPACPLPPNASPPTEREPAEPSEVSPQTTLVRFSLIFRKSKQISIQLPADKLSLRFRSSVVKTQATQSVRYVPPPPPVIS